MEASYIIRAFAPKDQAQVEALVLEIQQAEFGLALTAENQPDLKCGFRSEGAHHSGE